jgi:uncharacterized protein (TIGR02145 family)
MKQSVFLTFLIFSFFSSISQVGIGTATPTLNSGGKGLNILNDSYTQLRVQSSQSSAGIEFSPYGANNWEIQANVNQQFFIYDRSQYRYRFLIDSYGNIGIGTTTPNPSSLLEVNSTSQGFLPPRLTTVQRNAISNPATGLVVYNTTNNSLEVKSSSSWISLSQSSAVALPTVVIGQQQWMDKNLNFEFYSNGDVIPEVSDPTAWQNLTTGAWCYYNNDPVTGDVYGKLYNGYAIMDSRGLCPSGWHVPSLVEFQTLTTNLGGNLVAGGKMKKPGLTYWTSPNLSATNTSGFSGLPGGVRIGGTAAFADLTVLGFFWTSTTNQNGYNQYVYLNKNFAEFGVGNTFAAPLTYGYSVRCIRD